ncbi:ligase-associated DNA damage response DEXH box helicase [Cryomorphaceae bacterium]|nr:ligase-associated DNA damage response DEXH box helicase [Cryomorphaceae bacterium]
MSGVVHDFSLVEKGFFEAQGWSSFPFQQEVWQSYLDGYHGLLNAPTGSGKTYALFMAVLLQALRDDPANAKKAKKGLQLIWISPIRALSKEIQSATSRALEQLGFEWEVGVRTGDTSQKERAKQSRRLPEVLITTPESMHLLLAQKDYPRRLKPLKAVVVDEWHELIGSKRGVLVELALSRIRGLRPDVRTWAISATIGNRSESLEVFLGETPPGKERKRTVVVAPVEKKIEVESVLPDEIEEFPWSGHLGIRLLEKVVPIIEKSKSTLIFTNTRAQAEIWYQRLLAVKPELAGLMAMHHGSIDKHLRHWVEDAIHEERLKAVVCTSSLDLGVDFRPVETIVQIGSPKGVGRFLQRAGRSGHRPGATSHIYFVPTNSLELIEASALRFAMQHQLIEQRTPYIRCFDVLTQYLITLAVSEGFDPQEIYREVKATHCYNSMDQEEWSWILRFITSGGESLNSYSEFKKVEIEDGRYVVRSRRTAMRHRMSIGTIVSSANLTVKFKRGPRIGSIEEWSIGKLNPGDAFHFGGRTLELIRIDGMTAEVKLSKKKKAKVLSYMGGRMPLSSQMSEVLRKQLTKAISGGELDIELETLQPLIAFQAHRSAVPREDQLLIEHFETRDGHHLSVYPFEGRMVHEAMAALLAYRIGLLEPISFSMAYSDYGFELLSDRPIPIQDILDNDLFTSRGLSQDLQASLNSSELATRQFRDVAQIAGLVWQGYPGQPVKLKHLQSSTKLFFKVFEDYEPDNLLLRQAFDEVFQFQLEEARLHEALERIAGQEWLIRNPEKPSPFAFHLMVDRLRESISSETLEDRIKKMQVQFA